MSMLQNFVPYHKSILWKIHNSYFSQRGIAAWEEGDIPHYSTNNYPMARQHAKFCVQAFSQLIENGVLHKSDPIYILEIGSGIGTFLVNFVKALRNDCADLGLQLLPRIKYIFSDYSKTSVAEATQKESIKILVNEGMVIPAIFDLCNPTILRTLDGEEIENPLSMIISNYVCCVSPVRQFLFENKKWKELHVKVTTPSSEQESNDSQTVTDILSEATTNFEFLKELELQYKWQKCTLESEFSKKSHAEILKILSSGQQKVSICYPYTFVDFMEAMSSRIIEGGIFLINDYGNTMGDGAGTLEKKSAQMYGNTMNHAVHFSLFHALAKHFGWGCVSTPDPVRSIHHACVSNSSLPSTIVKLFEDNYVRCLDGENILDFEKLANKFVEKKDYENAIKFFIRCSLLDAENPKHFYNAAEACIDADHYIAAKNYLMQGLQKQNAHQFDFEFQLGRACALLENDDEAIEWYTKSLTKENHPVTHTNIGAIYMRRKKFKNAYYHFHAAKELEPKNQRVSKKLEELKNAWWKHSTKNWKKKRKSK